MHIDVKNKQEVYEALQSLAEEVKRGEASITFFSYTIPTEESPSSEICLKATMSSRASDSANNNKTFFEVKTMSQIKEEGRRAFPAIYRE